jgi:hypothetical protein
MIPRRSTFSSKPARKARFLLIQQVGVKKTMTNKLRRIVRLPWILAILLLVGPAARSQPVFTVTPPVISSTYSGVITLNISGLTNTENVVVQKWLDLNGNGSIDPGEFMMDTFSISDGGVTTIGGITNVNCPYDINPAGGAIGTTLSCAGEMSLENIVGKYVFRVLSPSGRFSPVAAGFAITNAASTQWLSGIVYSNGLSPLPYALVVAQDPVANNPAGVTLADASGRYYLALKPGNYSLMAALPNFYFNEALSPGVVLTNGGSLTNNLFLTNGTVAVSGAVYDSGNSNGLGAVMLQFESGNLFAISFTDANGNYSASLTPAFWKIKPSKERLTRRALVVSQNTFQVNATAGPVTNASLALYKANALFYGRLTDSSNAPFANAMFDAGDNNNQFNAKGFSDANGNYAVGVIGTTNNEWFCSPTASDALVNYVINYFQSRSMGVAQVIQQNFVALPVTAHIAGSVHDNTGNAVAGVEIYAYTINGNYQSFNISTDNSGNYSIGVASGTWNVNFSLGGEGGLDFAGFADIYGPHMVSVPPTNPVLNIVVYPVGTPLITQPRRFSSSQFGFNINGAQNVSYTVQLSTNLASTNWTALFSLILTNDSFPVVDLNATNSPRFYRVQKN